MTGHIFKENFQEKIRKSKSLKDRIRLCAILAKAKGHPVKTIAAILYVSESTVYQYITEFEESKKTSGKKYPG